MYGVAYDKQFKLLEKLIDAGIITPEILAASLEDGVNKGINVAWSLACQKQFDLLGKLVDQKLVTSEILTASPEEGGHKGQNLVWLLAHFQQFNLLLKLIGKITLDTLMAKSTAPSKTTLNVLIETKDPQADLFMFKMLLQQMTKETVRLPGINAQILRSISVEEYQHIAEQQPADDFSRKTLYLLLSLVKIQEALSFKKELDITPFKSGSDQRRGAYAGVSNFTRGISTFVLSCWKSVHKEYIPNIPQEVVLQILNIYLTNIESTFHSISTNELRRFVARILHLDYTFPDKSTREARVFGKESKEPVKNTFELRDQGCSNQKEAADILLRLSKVEVSRRIRR